MAELLGKCFSTHSSWYRLYLCQTVVIWLAYIRESDHRLNHVQGWLITDVKYLFERICWRRLKSPAIATAASSRRSSPTPNLLERFRRQYPVVVCTSMTVRKIQAHLAEIYGWGLAHADFIRHWAIIENARAWQSRPLDSVYLIVYLDCLHVKVRDAGTVRMKAVYLALGLNLSGEKELLGLWIAPTEGAKFWLQWCWQNSRTVAYRISSSLAWMAWKASRKLSKRFIPRLLFSFATCIWSGAVWTTSVGNCVIRR